MSAAPNFLDRLVNELRDDPRQAIKLARKTRDVLRPYLELYAETHGGRPPRGRGVELVDVPDEDGGTVIEMGSMTAIAYLTDKEPPGARPSRRRPDEFIHDFDRPYPSICFRARSRDLVIVRGASLYTVTARGIEG